MFAKKQSRTEKKQRSGRFKRGQSLVEVALSLPILILVFSGAVDLGRGYFALVALDSAISEAAHYISIYPPCAATAYLNDIGDNTSNCTGTNSPLARLMDESSDLDSSRISPLTITNLTHPTNDPPTSDTPDEYQLSVTYRMELITPIIRGLFGKYFYLTATVKQVARSSDTPGATGGSLGVQVQPTSSGNCTSATGSNRTFTWNTLSPTAPTGVKGFGVIDENDPTTIIDTVSGNTTTTFTTTTGNFVAGDSYYIIPVTGSGVSGGKVLSPSFDTADNGYRSRDFTCP